MIYLIDDNLNNQQQLEYNADYLFNGTFDDILKRIYCIKLTEYESVKKELLNAEAILLHNTFSDANEHGFIKGTTSKRIRNGIVEDIINFKNIPFALFSRGIYETSFEKSDMPKAVYGLNKDIFYANLFDFLQHNKETKQLDFNILIDGKNYKTNAKIEFLEKFLSEIENVKQISAISEKSKQEFANFYNSIGSNLSFENYWNLHANSNKSIYDFLESLKNIKKSLKKYGRNIYNQ